MGCSDGNCILKPGPVIGQHTNGGCRCLKDLPTKKRMEVVNLIRKFTRFRSEVLAACLEQHTYNDLYNRIMDALEIE